MVSAVGQLNRPAMPDIEGLESFAGPLFHSARWRSDVDLTGRKVAVIGSGCMTWSRSITRLSERTGFNL